MKRIFSILLAMSMLFTLSTAAFAEANTSRSLVIIFEDGSERETASSRAIDIRDATVQIRIFVDNRSSTNSSHSLFARCSIIGFGTTEVVASVSVYKGGNQIQSTVTRSGEKQTVAQFRLDNGTTGYEANATYTCVVNTSVTKNGITQTDSYTRNIVLDTSSATFRFPSDYGQSKTHWCWVASSICVAENNFDITIPKDTTVLSDQSGIRYTLAGYSNGSYTAPYSQTYVANSIKGNESNFIGYDGDKEEALELLSNYQLTATTVGTQGTNLSTSQLNQLKAELARGKYVIGNLYATNFGGHSVVIKEYRSSDNKFRIYDPWDETDLYYDANAVFYGNGFVVSGCYGRIQWLQYCS